MTTVTSLNRGPFWVTVLTETKRFEHTYTNTADVLIACKDFAQTALVLTPNAQIEITAQAGDQQWQWKPSDGNTLVGVNGTRDWQIFKSCNRALAVSN